jgi:AcrR family transcriptional regulator
MRKMSGDQRGNAQATRRRLLNSFNTLVLSGANGKITVSDIVREAGLGRSTFYDHYSSAEDIHQQALAGPMTLLAEAILGPQTEERLSYLLKHFWENRERARRTLSGEEGEQVEQLLISILESRVSTGPGLDQEARKVAAIELAVVPLALIRAWLHGTVHCSAKRMARHIAEASAAMRTELL